MLVTCPHCKKKIGEGQTECPMCKVSFSKEDIGSMSREKSENLRKLEREKHIILLSFRKKRKAFLIALGISFVITLSSFPLMFRLALTQYSFLAYPGFLAIPAVIVAGIITGGARCPFCGAILMRQHGDHCSSCGERIL